MPNATLQSSRSVEDTFGAVSLPKITGNRIVIVGGGMYGLSLAYHYRRRGADVTVVERTSRLPVNAGAMLNFGWCSPQELPRHHLLLGLRSRDLHRDLLKRMKFPTQSRGSITVVKGDAMRRVARQFIEDRGKLYGSRWIKPAEVFRRAPLVKDDGKVLGGVSSRHDFRVSSPDWVAAFVAYLQKGSVKFHFGVDVEKITPSGEVIGKSVTSGSQQKFTGNHVIYAPGPVNSIFKKTFREDCKAGRLKTSWLQMMTLQLPQALPSRHPPVTGPLSWMHYPVVSDLPGFPALQAEIRGKWQAQLEEKIHIIAAVNPIGTVRFGDSHIEGLLKMPPRSDHVDYLMLQAGSDLLNIDDATVVDQWIGGYAKNNIDKRARVTRPYGPDGPVTVIDGTTGLGFSGGMEVTDTFAEATYEGRPTLAW